MKIAGLHHVGGGHRKRGANVRNAIRRVAQHRLVDGPQKNGETMVAVRRGRLRAIVRGEVRNVAMDDAPASALDASGMNVLAADDLHGQQSQTNQERDRAASARHVHCSSIDHARFQPYDDGHISALCRRRVPGDRTHCGLFRLVAEFFRRVSGGR
jgi:hypothetical protein